MTEMLIAILLWLGSISPNATYQQPQINGLLTENESVVVTVLNSPQQQASIWQSHGMLVPTVEVIDPFR